MKPPQTMTIKPQEPAWPVVAGQRMHPGDHICVLYRGRQQRDRFLQEFLIEGLHAGQKCLYMAPEDTADTFASTVHDHVDPAHIRWLEVDHVADQYLADDGIFSSRQIMSFWTSFVRRTFIEQGHEFSRAACEVSWVQKLSSVEFDQFVQYEREVTAFCASYPQVALCLYDLTDLPGSVLLSIINAHPRTLLSNMILENPYFTPS